MIEVHNLSKRYGDVLAVDSLEFAARLDVTSMERERESCAH